MGVAESIWGEEVLAKHAWRGGLLLVCSQQAAVEVSKKQTSIQADKQTSKEFANKNCGV